MIEDEHKTKEQLIEELAAIRQRMLYAEALDRRTEDALWEGSALRMLYEITSNPDLTFGVKVRRLLEMGCHLLGLDYGILSHVQADSYEVVEVYTTDTSINKGTMLSIVDTYCEKTIRSREPVYFIQARLSPWEKHPAYDKLGLETYIGVSVMVEGRPYGTLNLSSRVPRENPFTNSERTLVRLMAQWIGGEVERQRVEEVLALRAQELAALYEISLDINAQPDLSTLLQTIIQRATVLLSTDKGGLFLIRPDEGVLELVAGHNQPDDNMSIRICLGEGLAGRIAQTGEPMVVSDYHNWEGRAASLSDRPVGRILGVPLKQRDLVVGVLNVFDEEAGVFTEDDSRLLSLFAAQAAIAIENARLHQAEHRRAEQLEALRQVSLDLTISRDLDLLLYQIVERAVKLLQGDSGGMNLYRPQSQVLERVAAVGDTAKWLGTRLESGEGVAGTVWVTGQPLIIDDYQNWPDRSPQMADVAGSAVGTPIQWGDEFLGALVIRRLDGLRPFTDEDATLLSQFATHAAIAIYNARLYEQAQQELAERKRAQEQMRVSLREKEILLQEVNHRVKNNLQVISSLLRVQSRSIKDEKVRQLFRESQSRVESMSLIHERLYKAKDLARIDFAVYVQDLATSLVHSYEITSHVSLETDVDNVFLDLQMAIPCGLIINELVANALKYAFPNNAAGTISIKLKAGASNQLILTVSDNGVGLPEDFDFDHRTSLGLQLVFLLTDQLGGKIVYNRTRGTEFKITFPQQSSPSLASREDEEATDP